MPSIQVAPDGVTVSGRVGETVLAALSRSGYGYRTGCTRGGCGICKVDLVHGEVRYNAVVCDEVLSAAERAAGTCLSCRAVPVGDVKIALRDERLRRLNPFTAPPVSSPESVVERRSAPIRFGAVDKA